MAAHRRWEISCVFVYLHIHVHCVYVCVGYMFPCVYVHISTYGYGGWKLISGIFFNLFTLSFEAGSPTDWAILACPSSPGILCLLSSRHYQSYRHASCHSKFCVVASDPNSAPCVCVTSTLLKELLSSACKTCSSSVQTWSLVSQQKQLPEFQLGCLLFPSPSFHRGDANSCFHWEHEAWE